VGCYLRFSLSYRDWKSCSPSGVCRPITSRCGDLVQRYAPALQRCLRRHLKSNNDSWRMDETYVRVKGKWRYLYRAVDSSTAFWKTSNRVFRLGLFDTDLITH
jgi:IS6 family transposase